MSKIKKILVTVPLAALTAILCLLFFTACGKGAGYETLATPKNLRVVNDVLIWDEVDNALGYDVEIDGQRYETEDAELNVFFITSMPKKYAMRVRAYGDLSSHNNSEWSEVVEYSVTVQEGWGVRLINNGAEYEMGVMDASKISGKFLIPQTFTDGLPITQIADDAFKDCTGLTSIVIPDSIKTIGYGAFRGCVNLTNVILPAYLEKIESYTFSGCTNLTTVDMPMCLEEIGSGAFVDCASLIDIDIPRGVKEIGDSAFYGCKSLTALRLPDLLEHIGNRTFMGCDALVELSVDERNCVYKSDGNCLIEKSSNTLVYGVQTSVIPDYVESIGAHAFRGCSGLTEIIIPSNVESIGAHAFRGCSGLTEITIPSNVKSIGEYAFEGCNGLTEITIPSSVKEIRETAFGNCLSLKRFVMENGVEKVKYPLIGSVVEEVDIPDSLMFEKSTRLFEGCYGIKKITVSENNPLYKCEGNCIIRKADNVLIAGCISSEIPDYVQTIGSYAFEGCPIRHIAEKTENGGKRVEGVLELPISIKTICNNAFARCSRLITVQIPAGVTEIAYSAFDSCKNINSVFVGDDCNFTVTGSNKITDKLFSHGGTVYTTLDDKAVDKLFRAQWNIGEGYAYALKSVVPNCVLGEDNGMTYIDSFEYNGSYCINDINNPYRSGYEFMGWAVGSRNGDMLELTESISKEGVYSLSYTTLKKVPKGTTVYAVWKPIEK